MILFEKLFHISTLLILDRKVTFSKVVDYIFEGCKINHLLIFCILIENLTFDKEWIKGSLEKSEQTNIFIEW